MMKKRYFAIPILAIALHLLLSNLLYFLVERLVLDVFHTTLNLKDIQMCQNML